jgi:hypothetical protein
VEVIKTKNKFKTTEIVLSLILATISLCVTPVFVYAWWHPEKTDREILLHFLGRNN